MGELLVHPDLVHLVELMYSAVAAAAAAAAAAAVAAVAVACHCWEKEP